VGCSSVAKPIPKKLLFHSIIYEEWYDNEGWGSGFREPITIKNVRVEEVKAIANTSIRYDTDVESIVFIDRANSLPFKELKEKSKVTFNGKTSIVYKNAAKYDELTTPHHYEVQLK